MASSTVILPLARSRYFTDSEGVLSTSKRSDEVIKLTLDWTDQLGSDTISSVAYADSGVTTSAKSTSGAETICDVTGVGEVEITLTLSNSHKLQRVVRFYSVEGSLSSDYR